MYFWREQMGQVKTLFWPLRLYIKTGGFFYQGSPIVLILDPFEWNVWVFKRIALIDAGTYKSSSSSKVSVFVKVLILGALSESFQYWRNQAQMSMTGPSMNDLIFLLFKPDYETVNSRALALSFLIDRWVKNIFFIFQSTTIFKHLIATH